jgi:hypothetical protein
MLGRRSDAGSESAHAVGIGASVHPSAYAMRRQPNILGLTRRQRLKGLVR